MIRSARDRPAYILMSSALIFYSTYCLMVPVVRALITHCRSRVLKGISTRLVPLSRFLALSGYSTWCVVLVPTSSSKPSVSAWFILHTHTHTEADVIKENYVITVQFSCIFPFHFPMRRALFIDFYGSHFVPARKIACQGTQCQAMLESKS